MPDESDYTDLAITLSPEEYATAFRLMAASATHPQNIAQVVEERLLPQLRSEPTLLDAGAGSGVVAEQLAPFFSALTLLEPNPNQIAGFRHDRAVVLHESLQTFASTEQFDLVVLSHVLYHVPPAEWLSFVERVMTFVRPGGYALIVMAAARGPEYELCRAFADTLTGDGAQLIATVRDANYDYDVVATMSGFKAATLSEMETICRFLVLETCYTAKQLGDLDVEQSQALDSEIQSRAKSYRTADGKYQLDQDEDIVIIRKESVGP